MDHKELDVWKKALDLVEKTYEITENFPKKTYGLTAQIRRTAISVASNIAEGTARKSNKEFIQFLYISLDSLAELETQLIIAKRLKYTVNLQNVFINIENEKN